MEDAEAIFKVVSRREIAETTIMIPHPYHRQGVDWWINFANENFDKGTAYEFGLFKKEDPAAYVGNCRLVTCSKEHNNAELGFFIDPDEWNSGYATEACQALIEFAFTELDLERIYGRCMTKIMAPNVSWRSQDCRLRAYPGMLF